MSGTLFRNDIVLLRSIFIIFVLLYYFFPAIFKDGYFGVNIFFVISGYLITSIFDHKFSRSNFSFLSFYKSRFLRIFPALFFSSFIYLSIFSFSATPIDIKAISESILSIFYLSPNIYFWLNQSYFSPDAVYSPFIHYWSLGVEFHFYILYPLFLFFSYSFFKLNVELFIFLIFLLSLFAAVYAAYYFPSAGFYLLYSGQNVTVDGYPFSYYGSHLSIYGSKSLYYNYIDHHSFSLFKNFIFG